MYLSALSYKNNFLGKRNQTIKLKDITSGENIPNFITQTFLLMHLLKPVDGNISHNSILTTILYVYIHHFHSRV